MRKILVLRGGALGDFLVTLPALGLLRRRWPAARIELVGHARAAKLGLLDGCIDAVHSQHEARWAALYGGNPLPADLAVWLETFDLVLNYWPDPAQELARRFPLRAGQTFLAASAQPTVAPAARHFCDALRPLNLTTTDYHSTLRFPRPSTFDLRPDCIAIHPGSGSPRKNWPLERWMEITAKLDRPVLLVLGEAERDWADNRRGPQKRIELAENLPLPELAARLADCRLFLGHDSGVSHLAAAVGTPCMLLFGPTDPAMWAPPGPHVRVLRRGMEPASISVEDAMAALPALWAFAPIAVWPKISAALRQTTSPSLRGPPRSWNVQLHFLFVPKRH